MPPHPKITRWQDIERDTDTTTRGKDESLSRGAAFGDHFGFTRVGIHHERLLPGRRSSFAHAESTEDEFIYVLEGTPDVWLDGHLHRLAPGDAVGFLAGDAMAHTFLNNTEAEVRLLVVGDKTRDDNRILYPLNPELRAGREGWWWDDAPARALGPHDGLPDARRGLGADKSP